MVENINNKKFLNKNSLANYYFVNEILMLLLLLLVSQVNNNYINDVI